MELQWQPVIGFQALTNRNIGQKRRIRRYFRPISGQEFQQARTAELHGRGFSSCRDLKPKTALHNRRISSPLDSLVPKKGLGGRAKCFQCLTVVLQPFYSYVAIRCAVSLGVRVFLRFAESEFPFQPRRFACFFTRPKLVQDGGFVLQTHTPIKLRRG